MRELNDIAGGLTACSAPPSSTPNVASTSASAPPRTPAPSRAQESSLEDGEIPEDAGFNAADVGEVLEYLQGVVPPADCGL